MSSKGNYGHPPFVPYLGDFLGLNAYVINSPPPSFDALNGYKMEPWFQDAFVQAKATINAPATLAVNIWGFLLGLDFPVAATRRILIANYDLVAIPTEAKFSHHVPNAGQYYGIMVEAVTDTFPGFGTLQIKVLVR